MTFQQPQPNGYQQLPAQLVLPTMSMVIHADSKVGKSTLACTAPAPLVVFDAEGSTKFLPMRVVPWDPKTALPPLYDGNWDACMVIVRDYDTLDLGLKRLETGQHQFKSVVLDSISEIQRKLKDKINPAASKWQQDHWGELLRRMDILVRGFRDLTLHPINPMLMAVMVAESRMQNNSGRYEPSMEGGIRTALPYWFDIIGHLRVMQPRNSDGSPAMDQYGEPYEVRRLLTRGTDPLYYAGQRVQTRVPALLDGYPMSTAPPNMWEATPHLTRDVLWRVFPQLAPQQQPTQ